MELLISFEDLNKLKSIEKAPLKCEVCNQIFYREKNFIITCIKKKFNFYNFCSNKCASTIKIRILGKANKIIKKCGQCNKKVSTYLKEAKKSKSGKSFCNNSCAASYNNKHKTKGTRRSKLEVYVVKELKSLYPKLRISSNKIKAIGHELDIYIPKLKLAIELNGIFHYKPIFGQDKLKRIKKNDRLKKKACKQKNIRLEVIDVSKQIRFTIDSSQVYLNHIKSIINSLL